MRLYSRAPLSLIAAADDTMSRALETVFLQHGYVVAHTRAGAQTIELARVSNHDVLVLDESLEDVDAIKICSTLREGIAFDHSVPVLVTSPAPVEQRVRRAAYAAGAWEYFSVPLDIESIFFKLDTFLRARMELSSAQSEVFVNANTGLYTSFGLRQLAGKFGARALRKHEAFACVAFSPSVHDREVGSSTVWRDSATDFADVAHIFREQSRQSDIVGHMSESRLAVIAPDTDAEGARLMVARLQRELDRASRNKVIKGDVKLRAGFSAVSDLAAAHLNVADLVTRAESALNHVPRNADAPQVLAFEDMQAE
ncbi:MAG TPA: response regulator [Gemmatimonadaceae bacterium]